MSPTPPPPHAKACSSSARSSKTSSPVRKVLKSLRRALSPRKTPELSNNHNKLQLPLPSNVHCASGQFCSTPSSEVPPYHKCKQCHITMLLWCRGFMDGADNEGNDEYCILCSNTAHPENADFGHQTTNADEVVHQTTNPDEVVHQTTTPDEVVHSPKLPTSTNSELGIREVIEDEFDLTHSDDDDNDSRHDMSDDEPVHGNDDRGADIEMGEVEKSLEKEWNVISTRYQDVSLDINGPLMDMKKQLKQSVDVLRGTIARKRRVLHFGKDEPSVESQHFAAFADEGFFRIVLEIINGNESDDVQNKTTMDQLELFVRVILTCSFYGKAPRTLWDNRTLYLDFNEAIKSLGGIKVFE